MPAIASTIRRILAPPGSRRRRRNAEAQFRLITDERAIARTAALLAHHGARSTVLVRHCLTSLWNLDATTLYIQVDHAVQPVELVITRHPGTKILAAGPTFRTETATHEPAPNGAYLVERQYRRLGLYEDPPAERVVVTLRITAGSHRTTIVDVPPHLTHVTVLANQRVLAAAAALPLVRGQYSFDPHAH